jgi:MFS family permease
MSDEQEVRRTLHKRLIPLYIATFFQSFVLWYTIEKLFMQSIGFNNITIGLMVAVYSAVMLAVETPSGILADRWSRKGVLILASVCLSLSALIGGLSHGISIYLICAVLWGTFYACYSGMYDSIVYDTVAETTDKNKLFDFFYGRVQLVDSIALVLGGLVGSLIAGHIGLRATFFLSVPLGLVAITALLRFKEPTLHKKQVALPIRLQIGATLQAITKNRSLTPIIIVLILRAALTYNLYEFAQLWLIELHTPTEYYGVAYAVLFTSLGVGGVAVGKLKLNRYPFMAATILVMLAGCLGLIFFRNTPGIVISQFLVASGLISVSVIFSRLLHDGLSPSIRAGAASATSTAGRFIIIPLAIVFGYVSQSFSIYKAAYILMALVIVMALFVHVVASRNNWRGLETN